jgi:hypothetical protein
MGSREIGCAPKREVRRMLKRECMVTNGDRSEWKTAVVEGVE